MSSLLFVVSDPVLRDQLAVVLSSIAQPAEVIDLAEFHRGIWDFRKLLDLRKTLARHRHSTIYALGTDAAKVLCFAGFGLKFQRPRISGELPGHTFRFLNREFAPFPWPWAVPPASPPLNREETLARFGIPPTAFVYSSASRFLHKQEALPSIWGFEILRYPRPEIYLLIHGEGPKTAELEQFTRDLSPEGTRVRFIGANLPMTGVFGIADVVIATNQESLMAGLTARKPIIASRIFSEILRDGVEALLMDPAKPPSVATRMMRLIAEPDLRTSLSKATEVVRTRFLPADAARHWQIDAR